MYDKKLTLNQSIENMLKNLYIAFGFWKKNFDGFLFVYLEHTRVFSRN